MVTFETMKFYPVTLKLTESEFDWLSQTAEASPKASSIDGYVSLLVTLQRAREKNDKVIDQQLLDALKSNEITTDVYDMIIAIRDMS